MASQNGIIGEGDFGTSIPETQQEENPLVEERKMAKFTRTAEYKRQKAWVEDKIKLYQNYLPDGRKVASMPMAERGEHWTVANEIIQVLNEFLTSYESSVEIVKEADKEK
jgi:hypothetical protein